MNIIPSFFFNRGLINLLMAVVSVRVPVDAHRQELIAAIVLVDFSPIGYLTLQIRVRPPTDCACIVQNLRNDLAPCFRVFPKLAFNKGQAPMRIYEGSIQWAGFCTEFLAKRDQWHKRRVDFPYRQKFRVSKKRVAQPRLISSECLTEWKFFARIAALSFCSRKKKSPYIFRSFPLHWIHEC